MSCLIWLGYVFSVSANSCAGAAAAPELACVLSDLAVFCVLSVSADSCAEVAAAPESVCVLADLDMVCVFSVSANSCAG